MENVGDQEPRAEMIDVEPGDGLYNLGNEGGEWDAVVVDHAPAFGISHVRQCEQRDVPRLLEKVERAREVGDEVGSRVLPSRPDAQQKWPRQADRREGEPGGGAKRSVDP